MNVLSSSCVVVRLLLLLLLQQAGQCEGERFHFSSDDKRQPVQNSSILLDGSGIWAPGKIDLSNLLVHRQASSDDDDDKTVIETDPATVLIFLVRSGDLHWWDHTGYWRERQDNKFLYVCRDGYTSTEDVIYRNVTVSEDGHLLSDDDLVFPIESSGMWRLWMTNCQTSQNMTLAGSVEFHSWYGQLSGTMVGSVVVDTILVVLYGILLAMYILALRARAGTPRTAIESTIVWTIAFAGLQHLSFLIPNIANNFSGAELSFNFIAFLLEMAKTGMLFLLIFLISQGTGLNRWTVMAAVWYLCLVAVEGVLVKLILQDEQRAVQMIPFFRIVNGLLLVTDVILLLLMLCFLFRITRHLRRANQLKKLRRYKAFAALVMVSLTAVVVDAFLDVGYRQLVEFVMHWLVLAGIAYLWWPTPENADYERVMELPIIEDDDELPEVS